MTMKCVNYFVILSNHDSRLICNGAIQTFSILLTTYKFSFLVGFKHLVFLRVSYFVAVFTFLVCTKFIHTGQAYSAVEKHSVMADMRSVTLSASDLEPTNYFRIFAFLVFTFFCVFSHFFS